MLYSGISALAIRDEDRAKVKALRDAVGAWIAVVLERRKLFAPWDFDMKAALEAERMMVELIQRVEAAKIVLEEICEPRRGWSLPCNVAFPATEQSVEIGPDVGGGVIGEGHSINIVTEQEIVPREKTRTGDRGSS